MELSVRATQNEFRCFLGDKELGLMWSGASLIDEVSIFHPADSNDLRVKIVFKNWFGGLHEAYHEDVRKTIKSVMDSLADAEISASFWLRPNLAHLQDGDKFLAEI